MGDSNRAIPRAQCCVSLERVGCDSDDQLLNRASAVPLYGKATRSCAARCGYSGDSRPAILEACDSWSTILCH